LQTEAILFNMMKAATPDITCTNLTLKQATLGNNAEPFYSLVLADRSQKHYCSKEHPKTGKTASSRIHENAMLRDCETRRSQKNETVGKVPEKRVGGIQFRLCRKRKLNDR